MAAVITDGKDERDPVEAAGAVNNSIFGASGGPQMTVHGDMDIRNDLR